jgi:hypothetical protein
MIKYESSASILFRHYLRANPFHTSSMEMKDSRGTGSIPFAEIKQAQIDYALAIESDKGVLIRTVAVSEGQPDYIYLRKTPSYIVAKYNDCICVIRINAFLKERDTSKRRSMTVERARLIAEKVIDL